MASSSESTEGKGAGDPPAKRRKNEETGNGNESNMTGCWIATNAYTGIPLDNQSTLYSEVREDLETALAHFYDVSRLKRGGVKWVDIGRVTLVYTVLEEIWMKGTGCTVAKKYVSHSGTVLWIHTYYDEIKMRHYHKETYTVYPPSDPCWLCVTL